MKTQYYKTKPFNPLAMLELVKIYVMLGRPGLTQEELRRQLEESREQLLHTPKAGRAMSKGVKLKLRQSHPEAYKLLQQWEREEKQKTARRKRSPKTARGVEA